MPAPITFSQLGSHLREAANMLRGPHGVRFWLEESDIGGKTQAQADAAAKLAAAALPDALAGSKESSSLIRVSLSTLLSTQTTC